jgi:DNA excision repair protein ERCC-4
MTPATDIDLPTLRGAIASLRPVCAADTREQLILPIRRLPVIRKNLYCGDYSLDGAEWSVGIERKSIEDLVNCCTSERDRWERSLLRLRGCPFRRLLIVGSRGEIELGRYRSRISPKAVLATVSAFEVRYQVPVVYCSTPEIAARQVESWLYWVARELVLTTDRLLQSVQEANEPEPSADTFHQQHKHITPNK